MHKEFKRLLKKATGISEHVIAINLDIRGFSSFCKDVQDWDVATYIKMVYSKILEDYFADASYYKPTGDGLIVIVPCKRNNVKERVNYVVKSCLKLLEDFSSICCDEPIINFQTPNKIGIGIARGSACRISNLDEDRVLDYSGRILNLASRLMDMARPAGLVIDESLGVDLLSTETQELFSEESVFVRGVSEKKPIKIFFTRSHVLIPDSYKKPLKEPKWQTDKESHLYRMFIALKSIHEIKLSEKPLDENNITVRITYNDPAYPEKYYVFHEFVEIGKAFWVKKVGNVYYVVLDMAAVSKKLKEDGKLPNDTELEIDVTYSIK